MQKVKEVKIGILGLGVVGSELVQQILQNTQRMESEYGIRFVIKKVFVKNISKMRTIDTTSLSLTSDANDIINDPEISVICECLGGNGFNETKSIVMDCLNRGKHVIMSSKKALAHHAEQFIGAANKNEVFLKYDATVGGGIPIGKVIANAFKGDKITHISGIFNATSNFIYTQMSDKGLTYSEALKIAQEKGYAENDPSEDVDGFDAANKLVILSLFASHTYFQPTEIKPVSFASISKSDMDHAREFGYTIKPMATLDVSTKEYSLSVGPCLVALDSIYACTPSNHNTIVLKGENCGVLAFSGQGAGGIPTASAMFDDLVCIVQDKVGAEQIRYCGKNGKLKTESPQKWWLKVDSEEGEEKAYNWLQHRDAKVENKLNFKGSKGNGVIYLVSGLKAREIAELSESCNSGNAVFCKVMRVME